MKRQVCLETLKNIEAWFLEKYQKIPKTLATLPKMWRKHIHTVLVVICQTGNTLQLLKYISVSETQENLRGHPKTLFEENKWKPKFTSTLTGNTLQKLRNASTLHSTGNWVEFSFYFVISTQNIHLTRKHIDLEMVSNALEALIYGRTQRI